MVTPSLPLGSLFQAGSLTGEGIAPIWGWSSGLGCSWSHFAFQCPPASRYPQRRCCLEHPMGAGAQSSPWLTSPGPFGLETTPGGLFLRGAPSCLGLGRDRPRDEFQDGIIPVQTLIKAPSSPPAAPLNPALIWPRQQGSVNSPRSPRCWFICCGLSWGGP